MNLLVIVRLLQVAAAACSVWSFWNGSRLRDRLLMGDAPPSWDWALSAGPLVVAAGLWLVSHYFGGRIGLRSELFRALIAWLTDPQNAPAERRLMLAIIDFLSERLTDHPTAQKLLADLADLLRKKWFPA